MISTDKMLSISSSLLVRVLSLTRRSTFSYTTITSRRFLLFMTPPPFCNDLRGESTAIRSFKGFVIYSCFFIIILITTKPRLVRCAAMNTIMVKELSYPFCGKIPHGSTYCRKKMDYYCAKYSYSMRNQTIIS